MSSGGWRSHCRRENGEARVGHGDGIGGTGMRGGQRRRDRPGVGVLAAVLAVHTVTVCVLLAAEVRRAWVDVRKLGPLTIEGRQRELFGEFFQFVERCRREIPADATVLYRGKHPEMLVYHLLPRKAYLDFGDEASAPRTGWLVEMNDYIGFDMSGARIVPPERSEEGEVAQ